MNTPPYAPGPGGGVWAEIIAQPKAVAQLNKAARTARQTLSNPQTRTNPAAMTHAWLIAGPPGSGRSTAATAFAAALQCVHPTETGCATCEQCVAVRKKTHPDVVVMNTENVQVSVEEIKQLLREAYQRPAWGKWKIIIVEDYDRVSETSSNMLLKSIEEPPPHTVWLLCAPSATAVLPTIRSRCRLVQLATPTISAVADLLVRRDEIEDPQLALTVAAEAGAHIGRARALAKNPQLRALRNQILTLISRMETSADACWTAAALAQYVTQETARQQETRAAAQRAQLLGQLGQDPTRPNPQTSRETKTQLKRLEETQKKQNRRLQNDTWDRLLEDLAGFYRDAILISENAHLSLHNPTLEPVLKQYVARGNNTEINIAHLEAIQNTRRHLAQNGQINLALEDLCLQLIPQTPH